MHPVICRVGPVDIYAFGVMVALAAVLCSFLMARDGRALGIPSQDIYDLVFWTAFGGIIGSRVFFILLNLPFFVSDPAQVLMINQGGLAWQGGLIFGAVFGVATVRRQKRPVAVMADLASPYLALGHAVGRIGCFLNGCCYGKAAAWGVYFPVHGARLHPTQLYEFAALVVLFFLLKRVRAVPKKAPGTVFAVYLMCASVIRFLVEFFRADHEPLMFHLSVFQYVSMVLFLAGAGLLFFVRRRHV